MVRLVVAAVPLLMIASSCSGDPSAAVLADDWSPQPEQIGGLQRLAYTEGERLLLETGGGEREFVAGVNLGPTIPGYFPGEQPIRAEDFRRWFPQIAALGLRAVRIYTIMPPSFYEELRAYNTAHLDAPLYVVHGIWIPEEKFYATQNLFAPEVREGFKDEIERAVAVVHGDVELAVRPGHASGEYAADVTPWLMSWVVGVEWDPRATMQSDLHNQTQAPFAGEFFESEPGASPTEVWLAEMLDHLAAEEDARGITMPLAFVNWPTTDPLVHPAEPNELEDLVGVDANHISPTDRWLGGYFASYHAYPYYPDFQRYEDGIANFEFEGRVDPYAGYLTALQRHHEGMPVVIAEFGVPSGMAHAHFGPLGRDQGDHSEQEQMAINAELLEVVKGVGLSGGFFFQWTDEWFKFTWNTVEYEIPEERRPLWMNPWTNEAHFGLVAVEPGAEPVVVIDGEASEWTENGSQVIMEGRGPVREIRAIQDEGYLYLRLLTDQVESWNSTPITVGFDLIDGGNGGLPGLAGVVSEADYALTIDSDEAMVWVRASNDPFLIQYGLVHEYADFDLADLEKGSGAWNPQRLIVNRPLTVPTTGEALEAEVIEVGRLRRGSSNPLHPEFDSRATWQAMGNVIEVRLPFQAIGFSDPSSMLALVVGGDGSLSTTEVERLGITVAVGDEVIDTNGYAWETWQLPTWHERLKAGSDVLRDAITTAPATP